jgi:hypothetical protein
MALRNQQAILGKMIMEDLAKDETYCIKTDCEIIAFTPGINNRGDQPEMPCDEVYIWAKRALAANGFGDY